MNGLSDHPVSFATVFGSAATVVFQVKSDINITVAFDAVRPTDDGYSEIYLGLLSDLGDSISRDVDVADVHSRTPRFARTVFDSGVVIDGTLRGNGDPRERVGH